MSLLLPALGNGLVTVGEFLGAPSGVTALVIAGVPLWAVLYRVAARDHPGCAHCARRAGRSRRTHRPGGADRLHRRHPVGALLLTVFSTLCWSFGSWLQPRLTLPRDSFVLAVYEMAIDGALMLGAGLLRGESWDWHGISARSWTASTPSSRCSSAAWSSPNR